jgi:hypothetical protein
MARARSDISNTAIRIFLQEVGKNYDEARGLEPFGQKKAQKQELLEAFNHSCCYCGKRIDIRTISLDHLIPMNKDHLGLHAWGNVVPCCQSCNNEKHSRPWPEFLKAKCSGSTATRRRRKIQSFVKSRRYDPNLNLHGVAGNLYQDVGAVVMTLIELRIDQAQEKIAQLTGMQEE